MGSINGLTGAVPPPASSVTASPPRVHKLTLMRARPNPKPTPAPPTPGAAAPGIAKSAAIRAAAALIGGPPVASPPTPDLLGDVNGDGKLGMDDAKSLLAYLFRGTEPPQGIANADINGDGSLNISDAISLFNLLARRDDPLPLPAPVIPTAQKPSFVPTVNKNAAQVASVYKK